MPDVVPDALPAPGYAGDLTPQQAWDLLLSDEDALLVDVRTRGEWAQIGVPDGAEIGDRVAFVEWTTEIGRAHV